MKQLLLAVLLLFACTSKAEEAVDLTGAQQAEQIIQQCTNPRWDEYKKDASVWSDYHLESIIKEEIECKEKAFMNVLKTILPDENNREEVERSYHEYKVNFLKMYGLISTKNSSCGEESLGCGTLGEIADTMLFNTALEKLITYTLERQDGTY